MKDVADARVAAGGCIEYEVENVSIHNLDTGRPAIRYSKNGEPHEIVCEFIAGATAFTASAAIAAVRRATRL